MMNKPEILTAGNRLQLRFARRGDRWEHAVELRTNGQDGQLIWQLNSAEGSADEISADDDWPPSPPFQNLEMHSQPDGRKFALLVGMAGASHWSGSIETDPIGERIVFDVACRIRFEPKWLGSSYDVSDFNGKHNIADDRAGERSLGSRPRIEAIPLGSTVGGPESAVTTAGPRILVGVTDLSGSLPRTVRWKYSISIKS